METIQKLNKDLLIRQFNEFKVETFDELDNIVNYLKIKINNIKEPFLEKDIDELNLSSRAFNCLMFHLQKNDLYDRSKYMPQVKDIINISLNKFIKDRNVGQKSISEIESILSKNGYSLKP